MLIKIEELFCLAGPPLGVACSASIIDAGVFHRTSRAQKRGGGDIPLTKHAWHYQETISGRPNINRKRGAKNFQILLVGLKAEGAKLPTPHQWAASAQTTDRRKLDVKHTISRLPNLSSGAFSLRMFEIMVSRPACRDRGGWLKDWRRVQRGRWSVGVAVHAEALNQNKLAD
jgi:hypothetical protein